MNLNLGELDLSEIPFWPKSARILFVALVCLSVAFLIYLFDLRPLAIMQERLDAEVKSELEKARALYFQRQFLPALRAHIAKQESMLKAAVVQLPRTTEMPSLLEDISRTGLASGLEIRAIQPMGETDRDFYMELPVDITAKGGYHAIGRFISDVSNLPRIATFHDFKITVDEDERLLIRVMAKTYYHEDQRRGNLYKKPIEGAVQ